MAYGIACSRFVTLQTVNFCYPDGNDVIKAELNYYKLHSSRLARYCVYFKKLFTDDANDYEDRRTKVGGCPIYHTPTDLDSYDFENLLAVLETPLYVPAPVKSRCIK